MESVVCLLAANEDHGPVLHLRQVEHACEGGPSSENHLGIQFRDVTTHLRAVSFSAELPPQ